MEHAYSQVDVFTSTALLGNPLAVVHDAAGLSDAQMQAFARWTQLSETTYVLPPTEPGADYRIIFTLPSVQASAEAPSWSPPWR